MTKPMPAKTKRRLLEALAEQLRTERPGHEIEIVELPAPDDRDHAIGDRATTTSDDDPVDRQS
jgi:hypothetical protein